MFQVLGVINTKHGPRGTRQKKLQILDPAVTHALGLSRRRIPRQICVCHTILYMWVY
jgi:hypothetical protein